MTGEVVSALHLPSGRNGARERRLALVTCLPLILEAILKDAGFPPLWPAPPPQSRNCFSHSVLIFLSSCTNSTRPTVRKAAPRHLWSSRRVTVENFSRGPVGKTGSGGGRIGRAWRTLCKGGPRFIPLIRSVQCSQGAQLWQDPQCPAVTKLAAL